MCPRFGAKMCLLNLSCLNAAHFLSLGWVFLQVGEVFLQVGGLLLRLGEVFLLLGEEIL